MENKQIAKEIMEKIQALKVSIINLKTELYWLEKDQSDVVYSDKIMDIINMIDESEDNLIKAKNALYLTIQERI